MASIAAQLESNDRYLPPECLLLLFVRVSGDLQGEVILCSRIPF